MRVLTNIQVVLFLVIALVVVVLPTQAQEYFTGKITYKVDYASPEGHENASHLAQENEIDSIVYYIAEGSYKSETFFNNQITESYAYPKNSEWVHYQFPEKDYYLSIDVSTDQMNQDFQFDWTDEEEMILDFQSKKAKLKQAYTNEEVFYAAEIKVDPAHFKQHIYANWYTTLKNTNGALPLKNIQYDSNFVEIKEAIQVEVIEFADDFFQPNENYHQIVYREILDEEAQLKEFSASTEKCYDQLVEEIDGAIIIGKNDHYLIQVVIDEKGKPILANAIDENGKFATTAEEIILNCGFKFRPAKYKGKNVKSELYIPIQL